MRRPKRVAVGLLLLCGVALGAVTLWQRSHAPLLPLELALWYWHSPFRVPPEEGAQLEAMGVKQLFVRAGTFRREGEGATLILPQEWKTPAPGLDIHLVFNFDYDIVRNFKEMSVETLTTTVREGMARQQERAESAGVRVVGVQLDFDCPTRRLPKYAELLAKLRPVFAAQKKTLSITALPTWYGSDEVQKVLDAVDFAVPQYYEAEIPKTRDKFATVSQLKRVERGLRAAERRGQPFYVGLPAYGHALVYNEAGKLVGLFRDMGVREAARYPAFRLDRTYPADANGQPAAPDKAIGEEIVELTALEPADDGRGKGYQLVYDLPTPALVAQHLALVRAQRPRHCRGVILFRYPEPEGTMTLPFPSLAAAIRGEKAAPRLNVRFRTASAPWELIETGSSPKNAPSEVTVYVTNAGTASTTLATDAVTLTLTFDRAGLDEASKGDFDALESFAGDARASLHRANTLRVTRLHLAAGETAKLGPLHLPANGATTVRGAWTATSAGRLETLHGDIPATPLTPQEDTRP